MDPDNFSVGTFLMQLRPKVYYPALNPITGSLEATIFLSMLFYWFNVSNDNYTGLAKNKKPYIWKTTEEIEKETGLSYKQHYKARKDLVKRGFMRQVYNRKLRNINFYLEPEHLDNLSEAIVKHYHAIQESRSTSAP